MSKGRLRCAVCGRAGAALSFDRRVRGVGVCLNAVACWQRERRRIAARKARAAQTAAGREAKAARRAAQA